MTSNMLTPPIGFDEVKSLSGGLAREVQLLQSMATNKKVLDAKKKREKRKVKKRRKKRKSPSEVFQQVGQKMASAAKKKVDKTREALRTSGETLVKPFAGREKREVTNDEYLSQLEDVFDILSTEPFHTQYNYYAENLPGLSNAGPEGTTDKLPLQYFDELNVPPREQPSGLKGSKGLIRFPGQFFPGEERQYDAAVRDLYQAMIDRIYEMWKGLEIALSDTDTWSSWARSWITEPLKIDQQDARALIAALKLSLEKLCTSNAAQAVCQIRQREKKFETAKRSGLQLDVNQLWLNHCGAKPKKASREGSMLCDFGRDSSTARLLMRLRPVAPPLTLRDKRSDIVVSILNGVLSAVLPASQYWQMMIDDVQALPAPLTTKEQREIEKYKEKLQAASEAEVSKASKQTLFSKLASRAAGVALPNPQNYIDMIKAAKQQRLAGGNFTLQDLDPLVDKLQPILKFDAVRQEINKMLRDAAGLGLEIA